MTRSFSNKDNDKKSVVLISVLEKEFGLLVCKEIQERWQKKQIKNWVMFLFPQPES